MVASKWVVFIMPHKIPTECIALDAQNAICILGWRRLFPEEENFVILMLQRPWLLTCLFWWGVIPLVLAVQVSLGTGYLSLPAPWASWSSILWYPHPCWLPSPTVHLLLRTLFQIWRLWRKTFPLTTGLWVTPSDLSIERALCGQDQVKSITRVGTWRTETRLTREGRVMFHRRLTQSWTYATK